MFVAVTRVKNLPAGARERMTAAFRQGARDLEQFSGFLGLELWTTADSLDAVSRWESRDAMEAYAASGAFAAHHGGQSRGGEVVYYDAEVIR